MLESLVLLGADSAATGDTPGFAIEKAGNACCTLACRPVLDPAAVDTPPVCEHPVHREAPRTLRRRWEPEIIVGAPMPADTRPHAHRRTGPAQARAAVTVPLQDHRRLAGALFGAIGLHRIYLNGAGDKLAWAHVPFTALGLVGAERMATLGQDDRLAWILVPVLGLMLAQGMLRAIVHALDTRRALGRAPQSRPTRARHRLGSGAGGDRRADGRRRRADRHITFSIQEDLRVGKPSRPPKRGADG
ncbi:MAG: hypothetical protein U1F67_17580 [Rubrivivax sp.]